MSGFTFAGDEVFVETQDERLVNMSKDRARLNRVSGEFVGISKVSLPLYRAMVDWCVDRLGESRMLDYETDALVCMAREQPIFCHKVEDLLWCEIDDVRHYANAREKIYPRVRNKEKLTGPVS
jgi:2-aminoethylphosphonate-pyruvate transaminase